jgi:hypothetical protein
VVYVYLPKAEADVTEDLSVRIEASFDNITYFPISRDVTTARLIGGAVFALERANGTFPYVRVRAVTVPGAMNPLSVWYVGGIHPIGNVFFQNDRFVAESTAGYDKASWGLCATGNCATGADLTNPYIVVTGTTVQECFIAVKTAPVGAALIVDILNAGTSIFGAGTKLVLAAGATYATQSVIANPVLSKGNLLTISITQIGSSTPGAGVSVACKLGL